MHRPLYQNLSAGSGRSRSLHRYVSKSFVVFHSPEWKCGAAPLSEEDLVALLQRGDVPEAPVFNRHTKS